MYKIAHIGDIHININATRLGRISSSKEVRENRLKILDYIADTIKKEDVEVVTLGGDIFDKAQPYAQDYLDFLQFLYKIEERKVFIIYGNHDEMTAKGCSVQIAEDEFFVAIQPEIHNDESLKTSFLLCPWGTPLDWIKENIQKSPFHAVVVLHGGVKNASHMWVEVDGEEGNYDLEDLKRLGAKAILLSHFHGQKELYGNIWYAGSPDNVHGFGEENDEKGFLIWEIDDESVTVKPYSTKHLVPTYKTLNPKQFLDAEEFPYNYLRIKGEVSEHTRLEIIKKLDNFKELEYQLDLTSEIKKIRVDGLEGKDDKTILSNYLKNKEIKNIKELLALDKEIPIQKEKIL